NEGPNRSFCGKPLGHLVEGLHRDVEVFQSILRHKVILRHDDKAIETSELAVRKLRPQRFHQNLRSLRKLLRQICPERITNEHISGAKAEWLKLRIDRSRKTYMVERRPSAGNLAR